MTRFLSLTLGTCFFLGTFVSGAITTVISTTDASSDWVAVPLNGTNVSDYVDDEQAQSDDLDLVGNADLSAFYTGYDSSTEVVGFRLRVAGDANPSGFKGQAWIGVNVDGIAGLDLFIGATDTLISINDDGGDFNTSPNTTSISATPYWSEITTSTNFGFQSVESIDPDASNFDIDSGKGSIPDFFITFTIPFSQLVSAAEALSTLTAGSFSLASPITYVAATAKNSNTLNSDLNGTDGNINSLETWESLEAISEVLTATGSPVPEPATTALLLGFAGLMCVLVHKRRK